MVTKKPPVEHLEVYTDLPEQTRNFLEQLRPEEVDHLQNAIRFMQSVQTVGIVMKWVVITFVSIFLGAAAFGDALIKLKNFWFGGH